MQPFSPSMWEKRAKNTSTFRNNTCQCCQSADHQGFQVGISNVSGADPRKAIWNIFLPFKDPRVLNPCQFATYWKERTTSRVIILPPQTRHYRGEIPQNDHTFALFDPPKMGNLMIPAPSYWVTTNTYHLNLNQFVVWLLFSAGAQKWESQKSGD